MNITFLIGNGFDIGLGMKSSFKDFFLVYFAKSLHKAPEIRRLSEIINDDEDTWVYFERQLGQYTSEFNGDSADLFFEQFSDFNSEFIQYLCMQEDRLSFANAHSISKTMINALIGFYLPSVLPVGSSRRITSVFEHGASEEHKYNFVTFNYTDSLQKCLDTIKDDVVTTRKHGTVVRTDKIGKLVHVHGTKNQFPIMGVNDKSQIANKVLAESPVFADRLIKPQINRRLRMDFDSEAKKVISSSRIICIYGMSLGETDKDWWDYVIRVHSVTKKALKSLHFPTKYAIITARE